MRDALRSNYGVCRCNYKRQLAFLTRQGKGFLAAVLKYCSLKLKKSPLQRLSQLRFFPRLRSVSIRTAPYP